MRNIRTFILTAFAALALAGCSISPSTWGNAVRGHAEFPALSVAILECTASRPDVQAELKGPFNTLADAWIEFKDFEPDAELLSAFANGRSRLALYKVSWLEAKSTVVASGLDCGPWVTAAVDNIENTFEELTSALEMNEKAVYVLDMTRLLADIFGGRNVSVQRI